MVSVINPIESGHSPQAEVTSNDSFIFPLRSRPSLSYKTGGRNFGAGRPGGRKHAGCDLIAPPGTDVLAMGDGKVIKSYPFWEGTNALEIKQDNGMVIRYCEISVASGMTPGKRVSKGQVIAYVKRSNRNTRMLHLEMYKGTSSGELTQRNNFSNYSYVPPRNYQRRSDLLDPTPYLDPAGPLDLKPGEGQVNNRVTTGLNVRSQPNTSSSILFRLQPGTVFKMIDEKVTGSSYSPGNRTDWCKIESDGKQGYVAAYYIDYNAQGNSGRNHRLEEYPKPFQKWVEVVARSNLQQQFKIGILAQSLHESGRGSSELALKVNNFNGMHFRNVHEDIDGVTTYSYKGENDWICANTPQTYLDCYLAFINRDRYQGWRQTDTPYNFIKHLFDRGYATDPEYMSKVNKFFKEAEDILFFDTPPEEHGWYRIAKCTQDNDYYLVCMAGGEAISKVALDRTVADLSEVLGNMLNKHPNARTWTADSSMDLSGVPLYHPDGPIDDEILKGKHFLLDPGHSQQSSGAQGYAPDYPQ
ncbi:MAG: peptidoglycan DD-metalloendopeptidase family protein [Crocosphaera sp.]